jgi:hypothetical protein
MDKTKFQPAGPELEEADEAQAPKRIDRCQLCKYGDVDTEGEGFMLCRRYPPRAQAILGAGPNGPRVLGTVASSPRVSPNDWCGEWVPRMAIAS